MIKGVRSDREECQTAGAMKGLRQCGSGVEEGARQ